MKAPRVDQRHHLERSARARAGPSHASSTTDSPRASPSAVRSSTARSCAARGVEGGVAAAAKVDELLLVAALGDVNVVAPGIADGGLIGEGAAAGLIVVADEDAGLVVQGEETLVDRAVQGARVAAREVAAAGAVVGHEQGVAGEQGVADQVAEAGGGVPGGRDRGDGEAAGVQLLVGGDQAVELAAVAADLVAEPEHALEDALDIDDTGADRDQRPREFVAQQLRAGEVVGVGVGLEDVMQPQLSGAHEGDHGRERLGEHLRADRLIVEDRVDHHRVAGRRVIDDVGEAGGARVEECLDLHGGLSAGGRCD
jgi:hypothetical protein